MNKIVLRSLIAEAVEFAAAFLLLCFWNYHISFVIIFLIAAAAEYALIIRCRDFKAIIQSVLMRIVANIVISVIICEIYGYIDSQAQGISDGGPGGGAVLSFCVIGSFLMFPSGLIAILFDVIANLIKIIKNKSRKEK